MEAFPRPVLSLLGKCIWEHCDFIKRHWLLICRQPPHNAILGMPNGFEILRKSLALSEGQLTHQSLGCFHNQQDVFGKFSLPTKSHFWYPANMNISSCLLRTTRKANHKPDIWKCLTPRE